MKHEEPTYVDSFDGLRGFAIIVVALLHVFFLANWVPEAATPRALVVASFLALDLLFFVSGFVLFLPLAGGRELGSLRAFAIRRIGRLAPAYWASLVVLVALFGLFEPPTHGPLPSRDALTVGLHGLLLALPASPFYSTFVPGLGINGPVWTLSVDALFYVVFGLAAAAFLRRPVVGLALALGTSVAWRLAVDPGDAFFRHALDPTDLYLVWHQAPLFAGDFAIGMFSAWVYVRLRRRPDRERVQRLALPACIASALLLLVVCRHIGLTLTTSADPLVIAGARFLESTAMSVLVPLLFAVFAVSVSLGPAWARWPLVNPAARWLGKVSYSVYLFHILVLHFLVFTAGFPRGDGAAFLKLAAVGLPASVFIGWVSWALVERPGRRLGRRLAARYEHPAPAQDAPAERVVREPLSSPPHG